MRNILVLALIFAITGPVFGQDTDTVYYDNGQVKFIGSYNAQNEPHGEWTTYYRNGQIERQGVYSKGHPTGTWKEYYDNGQLKAQLAFLLRGNETVKNGNYVMYHENGKVAVKGRYISGRKVGKWIKYDEEGNVIPEEEESEE